MSLILKNISSNPKIKIALGCDHAGLSLKNALKKWLEANHFKVMDLGVFTDQVKSDYPLYAHKVAKLVDDHLVDYGILVCFSGVGMAIAANRYLKVRALPCYAYQPQIVRLGREHNDVNLLTFSGHLLTSSQAVALLKVFLNTAFTNITRYQKRLSMLQKKPY